MLRNIFALPSVVMIIACLGHRNPTENISHQLENLRTDEEKKEFLEEIYDLDQFVRKEFTDATATYGSDSKQEKKAIAFLHETDVSNLEKISGYLNKYGYPTIAKHGKKACLAPWIVVHHTNDTTAREEYFPFLYRAYESKNLEPGRFSLYLNRFHTLKFGQRLSIPNPYREEDMIDSLLVKLCLKVPFSS